MVRELTFTAQDGLLKSTKPIHLSLGSNPLKLDYDDTELGDFPKEDIAILLAIENLSEGICFNVQIDYRGTTVANRKIPAYGSSSISLEVPALVNGAVLNIIVTAISILPSVKLNLPTDGTQQLKIHELVATRKTKEPTLREHLIPACEQLARDLGLVGNYMAEWGSARLFTKLEEALTEGKGFSIIRLGDGEGRVIAEEGFFTDNELLHQTLNYHFGTVSNNQLKMTHGGTWIRRSVSELRDQLAPAIIEADEIGFPVAEYFASARNKVVPGHFGYVAALLSGIAMNPKRQRETIIGTNAFQLAAVDPNFFPRVLSLPKDVSIVGPWNLLPSLSDALPGLAVGEFIEVQQHFSFRDTTSWGQFPLHSEITVSRIRSMGDLRSRLFLVAAGILGKIYCQQIKQQGGVAIDIGSVLDSWAKRGRTEAIRKSEIISIKAFGHSQNN